MTFLLLAALIVYSQQHSIQSIDQRTSGACSPNTAGVQGSVTITINCPGVPPAAMEYFNQELASKRRELKKLEDQLQAAEVWRTKYTELTASLAMAGVNNALSQRADELIKSGRIDEAGRVLDELLKQQE